MGRPPLPLGTMGEIWTTVLPNRKVRAFTNYRDYDGVTRRVERIRRTEAAARNALREACRDRGRTDAASTITPDTKVSALAEEWFSEIQVAVDVGDRSPGTGRLYRDRIDNQIVPAIGALRIREITVSRIDRLLKTVRERNGASVSKATRTVLSGMFGLAARHDAMKSNPVRDASPIRSKPKERETLTLEQVWDLRARLLLDRQACDWDLPELIDMMMATGLRIGETAAITWPAVDLDAGTVEVRGTVIRITGQGLIIKWKPKSRAGWRKVELPTWAVTMLKRRRANPKCNDWDAVFTSPTGLLRDPSNTQSDLRAVFARHGYPGVTSHTFRRTVATLMDQAGLSARAAADQLGHAKISMTQDHYFGRRVASTGAANVLEAVDVGPVIERVHPGDKRENLAHKGPGG
jgi:integrase